MTDHVDAARRSAIMARVLSKNTLPELVVRRILHGLGYRFRLHRRDLPGNPDIVLPRYRTVVFIHGCFWHRHEGCVKASEPKSRVDYWCEKFAKNRERDERVAAALRTAGWRIEVVWQCEIKNRANLADRLSRSIEVTKLPRARDPKRVAL